MRYFILLLTLFAVSCDNIPKSADKDAKTKLTAGEVAKIAEAPDGTILWGVLYGSTYIYFASSGTQHSYTCGKNCTRTDYVPTQRD